ncbi:hypothetical protein EEL32_00385 (plasmid) [Brevibacillus laterosporus]|nr:hypothetical protein [Brevibacillus laterosporus]TPG93546.1 hypothetical protein EEL32_00385 [Brevibacillus laterosporus]
MTAAEQQIINIDLKRDRIKRQLNALIEKNNVFESDLAPSIERLRLGRIQENDLISELTELGNEKVRLGWKPHASS